MADALVYADKKLNCDEILELSTLTGSCMSALGTAMAGLFTRDDEMAETLCSVGALSGDKLWRLPMEESYAEELKSKLADLKNIGGRFAGAITAALFLQNFVENAKFSHVDMAGSVWDYKSSQASGYGIRLVTAWVLHHSTTLETVLNSKREP
jgi:leucyl aminopeptidase